MSAFWETYLDVAYPLVGALSYGVVGHKLNALRRVGWDPALAAMAACPAFSGSAFLVATPVLYRAIDRAVGVPNLTTLLVYALITACGASAQVLLVLWPTEQHQRRGGRAGWLALRRLRTQLAVFAVTLALMVTMFGAGAAEVRARETPTTFDTVYASVPAVAVFLIVYQLAFFYTLVRLAMLCRTLAADPAVAVRYWHGKGLALIGAGSCVALGYGSCKLAAIALRLAGSHADVLSTVVAPEFASVGAVLIAAGFSATVAGPRLVLWRRYRQVAPLQRVLTEAVPHARMPRLWWEGLLPSGWRHREWQRQVMEARDAQVLLTQYAAPDLADRVLAPAGAGGAGGAAAPAGAVVPAGAEQERRALADAVSLRSGLARYRLGHRATPALELPPPGGRDAGGDVTSDQHDLARVALAFFGPAVEFVPPGYAPVPGPDPHERVRRMALTTHRDDLRIGLTLGLWRTFAIPAVASVLVASGGMVTDPDARAEATGQILFQLLEDGLEDPASAPVLDHLRRVHTGLDQELMRYVLTVFALEPIRFIDAHGVRPLDPQDRADLVAFYRDLAAALGVEPPPGGPDDWSRWSRAFEQERFGATEDAALLWSSTRGLAARRLPEPLRRPLRGLAVAAATALLDPPLRAAVQARHPGPLSRAVVHTLLALRRRGARG
ncbi:MAB_1171c family putative transporter [Streptacidiphilus sp. N1-3]|uniref:MAB_1171c family putative transporter n=1 Tax=Streptacidiphilus alkalitolerans TaxID=3342712 RepID=A0ABV6WVM4_9ACTN